MSNEREGRLVVISGPSGVGKSTVCDAIIKLPGFRRVVTCTTRPPRRGEKQGEAYHFYSREEFEHGLRRGDFLEHAVVHGNYYGTPREAVLEGIRRGDCLLLAIDVQGAEQLRRQAEHWGEAGRSGGAAAAGESDLAGKLTTIFLLPPDDESLKARLEKRGTEDGDKLTLRLETAKLEMMEKDNYDHVVVNDKLEQAVQGILAYLKKTIKRP